MAEEKFRIKETREQFFFNAPDSDRVIMIQAASQEEANKIMDNLKPERTTYVAIGPDGKPLWRKTGEGKKGGFVGDVVLESIQGQRFLTGQSMSSSDPADVEKFINDQVSTSEMATSSVNQAIIQENPNAARAAVGRQVSLGGLGSFADEAINYLFGGDYKKANDAYVRAMNAEKPLETFLIQAGVTTAETASIVGAFPQLLRLFGAGVQGSSKLAQSVRSGTAAGTAAGITSGIQSAGEAEDGNRFKEGMIGGGLGLATGGVIGTGTPFIGDGFNRVAEVIKKSDIAQIASTLGISRSAAMVIKSSITQGGDFGKMIQNISKAGEEGMIADAGVAAQALTDAAAAAGPEAAETVATNISKRADKVMGNLDKTLTEELGGQTLGPKSALKIIRDRQGTQRIDAYNIAYETPVNYGSQAGIALEEVLDTIDPSIMEAAVRRANIRMRADNLKNMQVKATIGDDGEITFSNPPNVMQLDYIKKALGGLAEDSKGEFGKITDDTRLYSNLYRRLRSAMNNAITDVNGNRVYQNATQFGGDVLQEEAAFKMGRDLLNNRVELEDVLESLGSDPSVAQLAALRMGLQQSIRKSLNDVKILPSDTEIASRQLAQFMKATGSPNAIAKIRAVMGDGADALIAQIDQVQTAASTRASVSANSKTQIRSSTQKMVEDLTAAGPVRTFLEGKPAAGAQQLIQELTGFTKEFGERQRQSIFNEISEALTRRGSDDATEVLEVLSRVQRGLEVSNEDRQFAATRLAFYLQGANQKTTEQQISEEAGRKEETNFPRYGLGLLPILP
jgi:hypothetical protein